VIMLVVYCVFVGFVAFAIVKKSYESFSRLQWGMIVGVKEVVMLVKGGWERVVVKM